MVEELQKNETLQGSLKAEQTKLREAMEQNDILSFNNTRLTKRVRMLQKEMKENEKKRSSSSSLSFFSRGVKQELTKSKETLAVIREDLQQKIKQIRGILILFLFLILV